eukprot:Nitzschia sp. Nitz4//scaffold11_size288233//267360//267932//NITZ4_000822-RA/size288233-processed-gene-0.191-mRNA-1//1//CDS//3329534218//3103//frame0
MSTTSPPTVSGDMQFGRFLIPSTHIFYKSTFSAAFVNLRPIVPGHVLVIPDTCVATMDLLADDEYDDMWRTVRKVQTILREEYKPPDVDQLHFNVAVQDGSAAGQTVPHVHVHILPRIPGDLPRNDDVYQELERWAPRSDIPPSPPLKVLDDAERRDRTDQQMAEEAAQYRQIMEQLMHKGSLGSLQGGS